MENLKLKKHQILTLDAKEVAAKLFHLDDRFKRLSLDFNQEEKIVRSYFPHSSQKELVECVSQHLWDLHMDWYSKWWDDWRMRFDESEEADVS